MELLGFLAGLPGIVLTLGALVLAVLPRPLRPAAMVVLPVLSYLHLLGLSSGDGTVYQVFGELEVMPVRIDRLAMVWGHVFHLAAFLGSIFAWRTAAGRRWEPVAALSYAGSALGAVFAGDLLTLFVYWELTAVTSVFLVWADGRTAGLDGSDALDGPDALDAPGSDHTASEIDRQPAECYRAGLRYLVIQVASGVLLLAGALLRQYQEGAGLAFENLASDAISSAPLSAQLIFLAFGIKAAFPLLHGWLQDAYPKGTWAGTVFLSAFTTKMAIYALARGFAGVDLLIPLGVVMTLFPIVYAVLENDLRKVLAYSLNNQLGFMLVGVGVGTELALNGAAAHAFAHILYKSLLFMAMGAVLYRAGTCKTTEIGGLGKSMPWTAAFCIVGSLSISAMPLFSGFVAKSLTVSAVAEAHLGWVFLLLMVASAGVVEHSGIKIPYYGFFSTEKGKRVTSRDVQEAPWSMRIAMGATAACCVVIGLFPDQTLYPLLPYAVDYEPYTFLHVVDQLQLLLFAALAYVMLKYAWKVYPKERRAIYLDADWLYRRALPALWVQAVDRAGGRAWRGAVGASRFTVDRSLGIFQSWTSGRSGIFARSWTAGSLAKWTVLLLIFYMLYVLLWG